MAVATSLCTENLDGQGSAALTPCPRRTTRSSLQLYPVASLSLSNFSRQGVNIAQSRRGRSWQLVHPTLRDGHQSFKSDQTVFKSHLPSIHGVPSARVSEHLSIFFRSYFEVSAHYVPRKRHSGDAEILFILWEISLRPELGSGLAEPEALRS